MPDTSADANGADTTKNTRVIAARRQASASRHGREKRIGLLPASHAPNKGRPRWPGFLTRGSLRRVGLPSSLGLHVLLQASVTSDIQSRVANRLQWRDRVGIAPTSHGRRGERQIVGEVYTRNSRGAHEQEVNRPGSAAAS